MMIPRKFILALVAAASLYGYPAESSFSEAHEKYKCTIDPLAEVTCKPVTRYYPCPNEEDRGKTCSTEDFECTGVPDKPEPKPEPTNTPEPPRDPEPEPDEPERPEPDVPDVPEPDVPEPDPTPPDSGPETPDHDPDDFTCADPLAGCTDGPDNDPIDLNPIVRPGVGGNDCNDPRVSCNPDIGAQPVKPLFPEPTTGKDCFDPRITCAPDLPPVIELDNCEKDETPPSFGQPVDACKADPHARGCPIYCATKRWDPVCQKIKEEMKPVDVNKCDSNPWAEGCPAYCAMDPFSPACQTAKDGTRPVGNDKCVSDPFAPGCRSFCAMSPSDPACQTAPNPFEINQCDSNPYAPGCPRYEGPGILHRRPGS